MEKFEVDIYYNNDREEYCLMGLSQKDIKDAGIEPQRRSWVNADYVETLEAKIDKLEAKRDSLREEVKGLWSLMISKGLHFKYQRELEQIAEKSARVSMSED